MLLITSFQALREIPCSVRGFMKTTAIASYRDDLKFHLSTPTGVWELSTGIFPPACSAAAAYHCLKDDKTWDLKSLCKNGLSPWSFIGF